MSSDLNRKRVILDRDTSRLGGSLLAIVSILLLIKVCLSVINIFSISDTLRTSIIIFMCLLGLILLGYTLRISKDKYKKANLFKAWALFMTVGLHLNLRYSMLYIKNMDWCGLLLSVTIAVLYTFAYIYLFMDKLCSIDKILKRK